MVCRFRPDLLDLALLDPATAVENCRLAFRLAEAELGIPALLEPEDVAESLQPDPRSLQTYLSQA